MLRRRLFFAAAASLATGTAIPAAAAAPGAPGTAAGPLRVGVDRSLVESGLAANLRRAFAADTGIAVKLVAGPALAILEAIQNGEVDAALTNAPDAEAELDRQGLVHDRRSIATGEFVLVGPMPRVRGKAAPPSHSGVGLLTALRDRALADPASVAFLSPADGSGVHVIEQELWRAARIAPVPPWYAAALPGPSFIGQVRARGAYALVERGAWAALGGEPLGIVVDGDPALTEAVHAMRSFRVSHPAGKIFVAWIAGGRGRAVAASHRGYRAG
jgi:tungstate transport system substrate-binding protein